MPKEFIEFKIRMVDDPAEYPFSPYLGRNRKRVFDAIENLLGVPADQSGFLRIRMEIGDSRLARIFEYFAKDGRAPSWHKVIPSESEGKLFDLWGERVYIRKELDGAPYLRLTQPYTGREMATVDPEKRGDDDSGWILEDDELLKKTHDFAAFDEIMFLSEKLKQHLEGGLKRTSFVSVKYANPESARRPLYQFGHAVKMPRCLTPRQMYPSGEFCGPECLIADSMWDDSVFAWPALTFKKGEVEALGDFDMATTVEKTMGNTFHLRSSVIVSQRFRQVFEAFSPKPYRSVFTPVSLV